MDTVDQRIRKLAATLKSLGHDEESSDLLDWLETGDKLAQGWEHRARRDNKIYYWQSRGPVLSPLDHVPKANPREHGDGKYEEIFEEVRKAKFPDRPSRLNCVFLCENLKGFAGGSYCSKERFSWNPGETYKVKLTGGYNIFKTNSEYWTEAVDRNISNFNEDDVKSWAEAYWEGDISPSMGEVLVSPPEAAIIVGKYNND
tara:strand:+ start:1476 stop:2078 length:603 start_codon:yes stop_codon:yes gene_type:complete